MYDELLDVVSDTDEVIRQETRSVVYTHKLNFRAVNGFIINSKNELWIPRRHPSKKLFPLSLDCSVAGHVSAGEDYDTALIREAAEELNIDLTTIPFKRIARLTPPEHGTSAFMWVYLIHQDETPDYNRNDFVDYAWVTPAELLERLSKGEAAKSDLPIIIRHIQSLLI